MATSTIDKVCRYKYVNGTLDENATAIRNANTTLYLSAPLNDEPMSPVILQSTGGIPNGLVPMFAWIENGDIAMRFYNTTSSDISLPAGMRFSFAVFY